MFKGYAFFIVSVAVLLTVLLGVFSYNALESGFQIKQGAELSAEDLAKYEQTQASISSALERLIALAENYPDLKANQNFLELQSQLEGTENSIAVARRNFNEAVNDFNRSIRSFTENLIASFLGLSSKTYLKADEGAKDSPRVMF
ncbi:MAG: LemA family protein [Succinatimonas hippei]|nr:LemA family protein [Succinatimonas hippei]